MILSLMAIIASGCVDVGSGIPDPGRGESICDETTESFDLSMVVDGRSRVARVHVPAGDRAELPVMVNFHGYSRTASDAEQETGMSAKADEAGFVAVYPAAVGNPSKWDVQGESDLAFFTTLLDVLAMGSCIDANRVYVTGMSMGGGMANAVGCRLADRVAGVASVAGVYGPNWVDICRPARPVPVLAFHALDDPLVRYDGGPIVDPEQGEVADLPPVIGVEDWAAAWAARNRCREQPHRDDAARDVTVVSWSGCDAQVRLYRLERGGHMWPGTPLGKPRTNGVVSATDVMWDFFSNSLP